MDRFYNEDSENEKPFFGSRDDDDDDDDDDLYDMEQDAIAYIQGQDLVDVIKPELLKIASNTIYWTKL